MWDENCWTFELVCCFAPCSRCSCSVEDGDRARIRTFCFNYTHHFIEQEQEHEHDWLTKTSEITTTKLVMAVR